ncbi:MAG: choice-of-anchor D domain-containing protein [Candidatus Acidiferrales bacterium]
MSIALTGTGTQPAITATPATVAFGNVIVGSPNSQTIQIKNTGNGTLTISQAAAAGTGYSISGLTLPANIVAGGTTTFNVTFAPNAAGAVSGSVSLTNNSATSPLVIPLTGTGVAATLILNSSTNTLAFGNVNVGSNSSLNVTLTNAGNSSVTVSSVTVTGTGYTTSGVNSGLAIAAGGTATLSVIFTPTSGTAVAGTVTIASNATNSPVSITMTGTGVQPVQHTVALSWTASTSSVVGYNVYRSTTSGGPYTLLTSSPVSGVTYTDSTVASGVTYYYVVTAVNSSGTESVYSNEASAIVPTP